MSSAVPRRTRQTAPGLPSRPDPRTVRRAPTSTSGARATATRGPSRTITDRSSLRGWAAASSEAVSMTAAGPALRSPRRNLRHPSGPSPRSRWQPLLRRSHRLADLDLHLGRRAPRPRPRLRPHPGPQSHLDPVARSLRPSPPAPWSRRDRPRAPSPPVPPMTGLVSTAPSHSSWTRRRGLSRTFPVRGSGVRLSTPRVGGSCTGREH